MNFDRLQKLRTAVLLVAISIAASGVSAQETPPDVLAAKIRDQGYQCAKAVSARKDKARSRPDEAVWVLRCDNRTYRVRLTPDMAARVQRLN